MKTQNDKETEYTALFMGGPKDGVIEPLSELKDPLLVAGSLATDLNKKFRQYRPFFFPVFWPNKDKIVVYYDQEEINPAEIARNLISAYALLIKFSSKS